MGNAISSAMTGLWLASHRSRVQKWLDNATEESVLDALTSSFFPGAKYSWGLPAARDSGSYIKETFGAYGFIDPIDKKRYWRELDLRLFLSNRFSGSGLNASTPILWRCFLFHAYFPFPQKAERIDFSAFQRAVGLLAAEGNLRLGSNANGTTMDADRCPNAKARASKQLWILFKSLSIQIPHSSQPKVPKVSVADMSTIEEDLMDVLALTQPDNMCIMPAPMEELRPHAKRILGSSTPYTCSSIPREDFLGLLKFILSIQLDKPEWGPHQPLFHTGRVLVQPSADILQGASDAILRLFTSSENKDVDWHVFKNTLSAYLPDFIPQFRLIFTSFLSPARTTNEATSPSTPSPTLPIPYAQYLNLFLHPPLSSPIRYVFEDFARKKAHYFLQTTQAVYSASPPALNIADLTAGLTPIKTGTLLLITGEAIVGDTHPPRRVTIGACMPTPWDIERQRSFRASPPQKLHCYAPNHMLFQLEPSHKILQPDAAAWIMDLIHVFTNDSESRKKGGLRFGAEGSSGLFADFDSDIATLRHITKNEDDTNQEKQSEKAPPPNNAYHALSALAHGGEKPAGDWETVMRIQKLQIYDLGGHVTPPFEEQLAQKPRLRTPSPEPYRIPVPKVERPSEPKVGEEELRKRIQGFGPSGSSENVI